MFLDEENQRITLQSLFKEVLRRVKGTYVPLFSDCAACQSGRTSFTDNIVARQVNVF